MLYNFLNMLYILQKQRNMFCIVKATVKQKSLYPKVTRK